MKNWREDAQPEWPEAASPTGNVPAMEGNTQAFPDGVRQPVRGGSGEDGRGALPDTGLDAEGRALPAYRDESGRSGEPSPSNALSENERSSGGLRDPWEEAGEASVVLSGTDAERNDPDEVTVQLDSPHRTTGRRGDGPDASDAPVFVDETGRRGRTFRRIGITVGLACAAYAVVIVGTLLSGNAGAPWLPVPGQKGDEPALLGRHLRRAQLLGHPDAARLRGARPPRLHRLGARVPPVGNGRDSQRLGQRRRAAQHARRRASASAAQRVRPPQPGPQQRSPGTGTEHPGRVTAATARADSAGHRGIHPAAAPALPGGRRGPRGGGGASDPVTTGSGSASGSGEETGTAAASGADPGAGSSPQPGPSPSPSSGSSSGPGDAPDTAEVSGTVAS